MYLTDHFDEPVISFHNGSNNASLPLYTWTVIKDRRFAQNKGWPTTAEATVSIERNLHCPSLVVED
jgi:hypothetical protein